MKLGASAEPVNLSWQHSLRAVWDSHANGGSASRAASAPLAAAAAAAALPLPPPPAVAAPAPAAGLPAAAAVAVQGSSGGGGALAARSAVLPSLQVTLDWLRRCVRDAPSLRMQVLVTGSLYLVGDVLKALQQPPPPQQQAGGRPAQ
jgi:folylpolyglutamate synthase